MVDAKYLLIGGGVALLVVLILATKEGAATEAGEAVGGAVVDAVGGAATGVIDGISEAIGIPTTKETITDTGECLMYLNEHGYWAASAKCAAPAFLEASLLALDI